MLPEADKVRLPDTPVSLEGVFSSAVAEVIVRFKSLYEESPTLQKHLPFMVAEVGQALEKRE